MELSEFRNLDYLVLIIIAISAYFAYNKGFIESAMDFFAWVGSVFIVFDNYELLFELLNNYIPSKFICGLAASIGVYVIMVIVISMFGVKVINFFSKFVGSNFDRFLGVIFGVLRGAFVSLVVFWGMYMTIYAVNDQKIPEWVVQAQLYKPLKMGSDAMIDMMTSAEQRENMLRSIARKSNSLEKEVDKNIADKGSEIQETIE